MSAKSYLFSIVLFACLLPVFVIGIAAQEGTPQPAPATMPAQHPWLVNSGRAMTSTISITQPLFGIERQLSPAAQTAADRYQPAVAYNSRHNEYLVVWHNRWPKGGRDVYARRVDAQGRLLSWFAVATGDKDKFQPSVAYNHAADEYLIVWMFDAKEDGSQYEIFGRRVAWDGSYQMPEFQIITWPQRSMWSPRVVWNSAHNEYLVVWSALDTSGGQPGVPSDISSMRLAADGAILTGRNLTTSAMPSQADVVYNQTRDEYFVVFVRSFSQGASGNDIYGLRVSWQNNVLTPPGLIKINDDPFDQNQPSIATNGQQRYVMAWESQDSQGRHIIHGQDLDLDGKPLQGWAKFYGEGMTRPAVAAQQGPSERYLVTWEETISGGTAVMASMFGPDIGLGGRYAISYAAFWESNAPAVAKGGTGYLIAYEGDAAGDPTVQRHIYGRTMTSQALFLPLLKKP